MSPCVAGVPKLVYTGSSIVLQCCHSDSFGRRVPGVRLPDLFCCFFLRMINAIPILLLISIVPIIVTTVFILVNLKVRASF